MNSDDVKNHGGHAFPHRGAIECKHSESGKIEYVFIPNEGSGMTMRDYFAAKAMQFCSAGDASARARQAYEMADAMLKECEK